VGRNDVGSIRCNSDTVLVTALEFTLFIDALAGLMSGNRDGVDLAGRHGDDLSRQIRSRATSCLGARFISLVRLLRALRLMKSLHVKQSPPLLPAIAAFAAAAVSPISV